MTPLVDFFLLIIFFVFYKFYDIYVASAVLIATTAMALVMNWIIYRKLEKIQIVTFIFLFIFGTLTLLFHNDKFIKCKVTLVYLVLALALLYSQRFTKQPLIQTLLGKELQLPPGIWLRLNTAWAVFFLLCSLLNIYVAFYLSQDIWVTFKVFILTILTLLFMFCSGVYIWLKTRRKN
ncbi:intracellular septation protein [Candidatus Pantoea carbekii]|uniref:Inner membrane-spanning protein YciB n=1 Tax=Candidatus Pantoea carbekii TaxID=1235990 RepID=U3U800_9GAMM|nr:intracellular septation protein [Candidatus Pantoea carbekii]